jgi:hypothetical protein
MQPGANTIKHTFPTPPHCTPTPYKIIKIKTERKQEQPDCYQDMLRQCDIHLLQDKSLLIDTSRDSGLICLLQTRHTDTLKLHL